MRHLARLFCAGSLALAVSAPAGENPGPNEGSPAPPADALIGAIPFAAAPDPNRVLVDLAPEGHRPLVMMLDTGASDSVVTVGMARRLGVSVRRTKSTSYIRKTRLGRDLRFWVDTRRSDTGSGRGWEYGLLGGDFLDDYVLELDFPGRTVRFLDPERYQVPEQVDAPDERVLPIQVRATRIATEVEIDGRRVRTLLDTGAPYTVILSGKAARKIGVDLDSLTEFGEMRTTVGPMKVRLYETRSFQFAGFGFGRTPILVAPRGWYNQAGPTDSVIGYDLLRQFVLRIDYARRRLWLKRSGESSLTFGGADYALAREIGAFLTPIEPGRFYVWGVLPGARAARVGLREGDVVIEPFGERRLTSDDVSRRIRDGEELTVARLQDDVWIDIILPDPLAGMDDPQASD